ncbi:SRPBCC family protein [Streptomyces sp. NPDC002643]
MVLFVLERLAPLPAEQAWRRLTDWPRHADVVPLTRIKVRTPEPTGEGTVFVARSGVGPLSFDDPMEVVVWQPPEGKRAAGRCRLVKRGSFVTGWAEIEVGPYDTGDDCEADDGGHACRVVWREELRVRWLPGVFDGVLGWSGRWMFGRAVDSLLSGAAPLYGR